jgi:DNA-binding SARP family transcriptional activator
MLRLRVLGECVIETGSARVAPDSERLFAALLYLCLERGRSVGRQTLIQLLWPGVVDENGRHNLRQTLYKARRVGVALECTQSHVFLAAQEVDAAFAELLSPEGIEARLLARGLALGEFLPGYAPTFSAPFAEWVEEQRAVVHAQVRRALTAAMAGRRARGRWPEVEALAREVLRFDPLNEEATLALAEATALGGGKVQALSILDRYLSELGPGAADIRLPASVLRRRIAERIPHARYGAPSEAYFLGRADSVALLTGLLQSARGGRGQGCLVWGPPGIGKTRLAAEFFKVAALQGVHTQRVVCQPGDVRRPLSVFVDAVPSLLNLPGAIGCSPLSMAYLKRLTEHDVNAAGPSEDTRDAEYLYANVRLALFDLLDAVAAECCLVLLVEDVHWLDPMSWDVVRELGEWAATRRLLVLLTSRESHNAPTPGGPRRGLERHLLPPLDIEASETLLAALAREQEREASGEFLAWGVRVAEGNPLFLRELATAWAQSGTPHLVPESLTGLLDDRLGRLRPPTLRVLQACAVLGKQATIGRLEAVLTYRNHELLESLDELESHGMLASDRAHVPAKHEILAERALARLGESARRLLHRHAGAVLERDVEESGSASLLWDCAGHWLAAGEPGRAVRLAKLCAEHLLEVGLPGDAVEIYERAIPLCTEQSERLELNNLLQRTLKFWGQWRRLAVAIGSSRDSHRDGRSTEGPRGAEELSLLEAHWRLNHDMRDLVERAAAIAEDEFLAPPDRFRAVTLAMVFADNLCAAELLEQFYAAACELAEFHHLSPAAIERTHLIYHTAHGDLLRGVQAANTLIQLERQSNNPMSVMRALRNAAVAYRCAGLVSRALSALREALDISEHYGFAAAALTTCDLACSIFLDRHQITEAQRWLRRAHRWIERSEDAVSPANLQILSAKIALAGGHSERAAELACLKPEEVLRDPVLRRRADTEGLWVRIRAALGAELVNDPLAEDLRRIHPQCRSFGGHDYPAYSLYTSLVRCGQNQDAGIFLREYVLQHRRERGQLPIDIRTALGRV